MSLSESFDAPPAPPPAVRWLSLSDYAAHAGVNKSTISRQLGSVIPASAFRRQGTRVLIDAAAADRARATNLDPAQQRQATPAAPAPALLPPLADPAPLPAAEPGDFGYRSAKARQAHYAALAAERAHKQALGALLDKAEVFDAFLSIATTLRESLDARRHLLAVDLVGLADPGEIAARLEAADDAALQRLVDEFEARATLAISTDGQA